MFSGFVVLFTFSAIDTALTPLSLRFFGWKEMKNSIYFSVLGILVSKNKCISIKASRWLNFNFTRQVINKFNCMFLQLPESFCRLYQNILLFRPAS